MGRTGYKIITGCTPDITMYPQVGQYDFVFYCNNVTKEEKIGRNLGPCGPEFDAGDCYWMLADTAKTTATNMMRKVTVVEMNNCNLLHKLDAYNRYIELKIGDRIKKPEEQYVGLPEYRDLFDHDPSDDVISEEPDT